MTISLQTLEIDVARHPEDFKDWKLFHIEYCNSVEYCLKICSLWLPPNADIEELKKLFNKWQEE